MPYSAQASSDLLYLLDTNIVSELARTQPDTSVLCRIDQYQRHCALSSTVVEELCFGIMRLPAGKRRNLLEEWLSNTLLQFLVLPYDMDAALWLGHEHARLEKSGKTLARADGQIAAVAAMHNLTLVTRNLSDYQHVTSIRVESWFERE